jgi:hypothetical protein
MLEHLVYSDDIIIDGSFELSNARPTLSYDDELLLEVDLVDRIIKKDVIVLLDPVKVLNGCTSFMVYCMNRWDGEISELFKKSFRDTLSRFLAGWAREDGLIDGSQSYNLVYLLSKAS